MGWVNHGLNWAETCVTWCDFLQSQQVCSRLFAVLLLVWEVEEFPFLHLYVGDSDEAGQQIWKDVWEELVPGGCLHLCGG